MIRDLDISGLTPSECILLAEQLWEQARKDADAIPVSPAQLEELNRRLDALDAGTMEAGEPWETVRARLWGE